MPFRIQIYQARHICNIAIVPSLTHCIPLSDVIIPPKEHSADVKQQPTDPVLPAIPFPPADVFGPQLDGSFLVVGGTDGSGTRRVVELLTLLGVTMVSEDPATYDIHADIVGGWPPVVSPVLEHTRSVTYEIDNIPDPMRQNTKTMMEKIINLARSNSAKPQSHVLAVGGRLDTPPGLARAKGVALGIKAPVAMTLVPYWQSLLPNFKFLHVVRDGRDIAFSANQVSVYELI